MRLKVFHDNDWRKYPAYVFTEDGWQSFTPRNVSGIKRIWPRSVTPPPAGVHYAWLGERDASVSVRLDGDGNETARNLLRNPSFTHNIGTWYAAGGAEWDSTGGYDGSGAIRRLGITTSNQGVYNLPWTIPGVSEGQKTAAKVRLKATAGTRLHLLQNNLGTGENFSRTVFTATGGWQEITTSGATVTSSRNPYILVRTHVTPDEPVDLWIDRAHLAVADTEEAALAQVEHYFDGDTESDRAHDLWYNQDGVPHEWVNGTNGNPGGWVAIS